MRPIPGDPHVPLTRTVLDHVEHYVADLAALGAGTHAIAFQSRDLARDIATAESVGLKLLRRRALASGAREAEFEPEAGVIVKLVAREP